MLTVPKLSHHPQQKRQNHLENLLITNLSSFSKFQAPLVNPDQNPLSCTQSHRQVNNKENIIQGRKQLQICIVDMNVSEVSLKPRNFRDQNDRSIAFLPSKDKIQQKNIHCAQTNPNFKKQRQLFSPKYMKQREENQKILLSLKLQNQNYKKLLQENEHLIRIDQSCSKPSLNNSRQSEKHEQFAMNSKKTLQKQIFYPQRRALEEMTNILTTSFIIDDTLQENSFLCSQSSKSSSCQEKLTSFDFQKIKFLGKGNFGQVNLVRHKKTNFICAMKTMKKSFIKSENVVHQISRQIRIHLSLKHLNIISFYGFFDDSQNIYILTQYATDGELYKRLKECYRMPEKDVIPILKNALDGLKLIHTLGYIHRDIKPENMIFQFGIAKICDLGWAADCGFNQTRKSYCGTPLYLSPEMIRKQSYDQSADIWSIGILTYELLVGKNPFNIWSQYDLQQIVDRQIKFPTNYVDMSKDSIDFMKKCLNKNPTQRAGLEELIRHPFLNKQSTQGYFNVELYDMIQKLFQSE